MIAAGISWATLRRVTAHNDMADATGTGVRLEYTFVPVRADYVALLRNVPTVRVLTILGWFVLVVLVLAVFMRFFVVTSDGEPAVNPVDLVVLVVLGVPSALIALGYARLGSLVAWRKPQNREPVQAVLDADGFSHSGPSGRQSCVWNVVSHACETAEGYYVYVSNGLAALVYWLPKRAVPVGEQAAVRRQIQERTPRYRIR